MDTLHDTTEPSTISEEILCRRARFNAWYAKNRKTGRPSGQPPKAHIFVDGIEGKMCGHCQEWKPMEAYGKCKRWYDGHVNSCKMCVSILYKEARQRDLPRRQAKARENYAATGDLRREWASTPEQKEKAKLRAQRRMERDPDGERAKMRARKRLEYERDPERMKAAEKARRPKYAAYLATYRKDPQRRLHSNMSRGIRASLYKGKDGFKWEALVGYTRAELALHLESQFTEGMTWENYGEWEIDHIRPLVSFTFTCYEDEDFRICWALGNLQPLWRSDNRKKWAYYAGAEESSPGK